MSDKKSCENCGRTKHFCESAGLCDQWLRNPHMWLSMPPTQPGWYWFKNELTEPVCIKLFLNPTTGKILDDFNDADISKWDGEWQGPITPEGG